MTRAAFARIALVLSLALPVYFAVAALGTKFGWWGWQTGLLTLIVTWGPRVIGLAFVLALLALIAALVRRPRRGWRSSLIALLIPAVALGYLGYVRSQSAAIPPIHDIATDVADPPAPSPALAKARDAAGANPVARLDAPLATLKAYQGPRFADIARRSIGELSTTAYPDVRPIQVAATPDAAFDAALAAVRAAGLRVDTADRATGRIEAVATSFWFGFDDDLIVRVRPDGAGSRIDLRSISRVGLSDLGANARRIEGVSADIRAKLGSAR